MDPCTEHIFNEAINHMSAMAQIKPWCLIGDTSLPEAMMVMIFDTTGMFKHKGRRSKYGDSRFKDKTFVRPSYL